MKKKRFCMSCLLVLSMILSAWALPPDGNKVTLDLKDVSMETFLNTVKEKAGINMLYNSQMFRGVSSVTVKATNEAWGPLLDRVLTPRGFTYATKDGIVVIKKQEEKTRTLTARVVDEQGAELPGVTVLILGKGKNIGTMTDAEGQFSLGLSDKNVTIRISFVGMEPLEINTAKLNLDKTHTFQLKPDTKQLDEVVVTGYAKISKNSFTGTSVTVSADQLMSVSKTNVLGALQAFDPSFRIAENNLAGSNPNNVPELYIRGRSGIGTTELDAESLSKSSLQNNPNLPTFIMDGFEISVQKLYDMDPSRIESITILKDAAATAMYGSRAANGVVVITTVAPKPGKININYNFTGTLEYPDLTDYNLMDAREKLQTEVAAGLFKADPESENYISEQNSLDEIYNKKLNNVVRGVNTYWLSKPLRTVFNHKHSLYLDGGTEDLRWGVDLSYNKDAGVMKESFRDRMAAGLSLTYRLGSLQLRNYFSYTYTNSADSPYGSFSDYTSKLPYDEYKDEYGRYLETTYAWNGTSGSENPLYEATLGNYSRDKSWELIDNIEVLWNITPHWLLKGQFSITKSNSEANDFLDPRSKKNSDILGLNNVISGELDVTTSNSLTWDATMTLSYNRNIKKNSLNFLAGVNATSSTGTGLSISYRGFPSGNLSSAGYAHSIHGMPSASDSKSRLIGMLGTFNYSYDNIYLTDVSVRFDGNSEFGADKRFAPFFSGGVGLNIHNYEALKRIEWLNRLKIRTTYGVTGKVDFSPYEAQTMYKIVNDNWYKTGVGASLMALGNRNLGWEKTGNWDIGLDVDMLDGLIQMDFSYYRKKTKDLVNNVTLPSSTGFTTYKDNIGEVMNKGVEIQLRSNLFQNKDWLVAVFANLAHNKNEILKISDSLKDYNNKVLAKYDDYDEAYNKADEKYADTHLQYVEGGSLTSIFGVRSLGINPADGREIFIKRDGSLTYDWSSADQVVIGNEEPKAQGTFGLNLRWKNFTLFSTFMYEFGGQRYNSTLVSKVENARISSENVDRRVLTGRWQQIGDRTPYAKLQTDMVATTRPTSRFIQDYNVLTFNSLTIGYDVNTEWLKKYRLGMLRFELSGNDLFRASTVRAERGLDYPYSRTFSLSVKMSL
ncbi:SusC/RagA family TonB-linked outer membrane protein [uncultured Bacteroides sp.]|uniref:SusC/RagA family TonB-linked outer membrane protein n=1 Tax=uncultured Bacteroides sp. TaxID=162156 RepID=UPI0026761C50|nr:SusC/RagA family TonB-linked outer membrane protein [uncultured Bacteroides sp.]